MKRNALIYPAISLAVVTAAAACFSACKQSATDVKGEEVDKQIWETALGKDNFHNYEMDVVIETEQKDASGAAGAVTMRYEVQFDCTETESKTHVKGRETYEGSAVKSGTKSRKVEYYTRNAGGEYLYKTEDGAWKKTESTEDYACLGSIVGYMEELSVAARLIKEFDSFRYNQEEKGYVKRIADASEKIVVKFKDGKLKAVVNRIVYGDELTANMQILYLYGGQEVAIPEI